MAKKSSEKIKFRVPYKIPEPKNYLNSQKLSENLEQQISNRIKQLKREGVDLAVHAQYLESVVDEQISNCLRELDTQYLLRINHINKAFIKRSADKREFQNILLLIETELSYAQEEFMTIEILYKECNPLYDGKTNNEEEEMDEDE